MLREIKRVFKDTTIYGLGSLLPKAAGIVLVPIYTRFLAPSDYGIMSLASLITSMVAAALLLGQNGSVTLYMRSAQKEHTADDIRRLLFSVTVFVLLFGTAATAVLFAFGPQLTARLFKSDQLTFYPYVAIALLTALLGLPFALQQAVNRARGQARTHTAFQLSMFIINTAFTIYFVAKLHQGAYGSLKGTFTAAAILAPITLFLLAREMTPRFSWPWLKRSLLFGLPLVPHYFAGWILTFADRTILARYGTLREVGLYSLAYNISMVMNLVSLSINQAWGPIYYDLASTDDGRVKLPRLTTVYAVVVVFAGMTYMLFAREALLLLATPRYWQAAGIVPIVVAGYVGFALYSVLSTGIFYAQKTRWVPLISAMAAAVNIGLNVWLVPRYGMWAAAWNTFIAYALMAVAARFLSGRLFPKSFEDGRLAKLVAVFFVVFAADLALAKLHLALVPSIAVKLVVLAAAAGAVVLLGVITPDEVRAVVRRLRRRGRRDQASGT